MNLGRGVRFEFGRVAWPQPPRILRFAQIDIGQIYVDCLPAVYGTPA